jgi:hypothetical protein
VAIILENSITRSESHTGKRLPAGRKVLVIVQLIIFALNLLAAVSGLVAAWYWFRSANVRYPSNLGGIAPIGGMVHVNTNPLLQAVQESGRLNKIAATFTGVAALLGAASLLLATVRHG